MHRADKKRVTFKRRGETVGSLPESIIDDQWSTRCTTSDWDYLFPNGSIGYSCSFCPTNPNIFNVCFGQAGNAQIHDEELVNQPIVKNIGIAFSVFYKYSGEDDDNNGDNVESGEINGGGNPNDSDDGDNESDGSDELINSSWYFTYSSLPPPTFSKCGKYFTTILNNGSNGVRVLKILDGENLEDDKLVDLVAIACKGGNEIVTGRCKMFAIHDNYAATVVDIDSSHNYMITIWRFGYNSKNEPHIRFYWSKKIRELFTLDNNYVESFFINHEFTASGKYITFLLANGFYFTLDIEAKDCIYSGHLPTILDNPNAVQNITNITHYVFTNQMHFIFGFLNECLSINPASNNIESLIKLPKDQIITHVRFSNTKELLSLCTGPEGNVFIYTFTNKHQFDQLYKINNFGSTSVARYCDFSWTSEELIVSYQNGDYRVWQFPRRLKLKEIARIQILKLVADSDIEQLLLPKSLKEYLFFR
ncbi:uncharacterized protein [Clytia hemisphaerica]|uniref:Uncharacterized protein n=1 Tax=Clytia hemisphaerica TaxID=252671 RepID=A0A7M5XCH1_9CNID|eukprot:TCONS_00056303-protein